LEDKKETQVLPAKKNYKTKTSSTVQEFAFSSKVQTMLDEPKDQMEHPKPSV